MSKIFSFPSLLQSKLNDLLKGISPTNLAINYEKISKEYRNINGNVAIKSYEESLAYAVARMPATFQVLCQVLEIYKNLNPNIDSLKSCLDMGSGPGTTYWALKTILTSLPLLTFIEHNSFMGRILKDTLPPLEAPLLPSLPPADTKYDLVIASYVVGELASIPLQQSMIQNLWDRTSKALIIIGPGTPSGFNVLAKSRLHLIQQGASIVAPCGHEAPCPLLQTNDWCHFNARLQRTRLHQHVKMATKGYEDEKYCYLIASRDPLPILGDRILKRPLKSPGMVRIEVCDQGHIKQKTFTKSKTDAFNKIKKLEWGDVLGRP